MRYMFSFVFTSLILLTTLTTRGAEIRGTVKSEAGTPLAGVSVSISAQPRGAATNADGVYRIEGLAEGSYTVTASMIGFSAERRVITLKTTDESITLDFVLGEVAIDVEEVVVTANKKEQELQTVAASITAVTSRTIEDLTIRQRTDLSAIAPNTLIAETGSHMTDLINIRGMFPSSPFGATTMYYLDGVPIYGYGMNPMILNDIERLEVLRGPQGTLYGRNALAGVVNVVSARPNNTTRVSAEAGYGEHADTRLSLGASAPLLDGLFARASGFYSSRDGYYRNTFRDAEAGGSTGYGGTANLRYFPSDIFDADARVSLEYLDESIWPYAASPAAALASPFTFAHDTESRIKKTNTLASLVLHGRIGSLDAYFTSTYQGISGMDWRYDADFSAADLLAFKETSPYEIITEELRIESSAPDAALSWRAGAFYSTDESRDDYSAILGKHWTQAMGIPISPLESRTTGTRGSTAYALFGQATLRATDALSLTLGMRAEREELYVDRETRYLYQNGPAPLPFPPFNAVEINLQRRHFGFISPAFSLRYIFDGGTMVYTSASRGFHGGGFNSGANKLVPYFLPENTWNYEVGYKATYFDERLSLNAALFLVDWRQQQLLVVGDLSSPLQTITNAGSTTSKGGELELRAVPLRGLSISLSLGLLDATLDEYTFHAQKNGRDTVYSYSGNELPYAPKASSLAMVKYELPVSAFGIAGRCTAVLEYQYTGPYFMSHMNLFRSAARHMLGARLGFSAGNVDVYLWGKNLSDNRYIMAVYEYRGGANAYLGAPRMVGAGVKFTY